MRLEMTVKLIVEVDQKLPRFIPKSLINSQLTGMVAEEFDNDKFLENMDLPAGTSLEILNCNVL